MAGNSDGLPGQHAFGNSIQNANRLNAIHGQSSSASGQFQNAFYPPHHANLPAGLQNGYNASSNYHPRVSEMHRQRYFPYQNPSFYYSQGFSTRNLLQAMLSPRFQIAHGLPSEGTYNPGNRFQKPDFTLPQSQNYVLSQGRFQQAMPVLQEFSQQNQQSPADYNQFHTPSSSDHRRMRVGTSVPTNLAGHPLQQYTSSSAFSNVSADPSGHGNVNVQHPNQTLLPENQQQQYTPSSTGSLVLTDHSSFHAQRLQQTFVPENQQQHYTTSTTGSAVHSVPSEPSCVYAQRPEQTQLPENQQQHYTPSNTGSDVHSFLSEHSGVQTQKPHKTLLPENLQQHYTLSSTVSGVQPVPPEHRSGHAQRSYQSFLPENQQQHYTPYAATYAASAHAPARYAAPAHAPPTYAAATTMSLQQQVKGHQSIDILNDSGITKTPISATSCEMPCSSQVHASSVNPAVNCIPSHQHQNQVAVQQPHMNTSHNVQGMSSSHQLAGASLPNQSLHSKVNTLVPARLQQKRGKKRLYTVNSDVAVINSGNANSHSLAPVSEYNTNQSGETEPMARYGNCTMEQQPVSTNKSVNKFQWYKYPETPVVPSFQTDIEAMQTDLTNYTVIASMINPAESFVNNEEPSPDACVAIPTATQSYSVDVAHGHNSMEAGCQGNIENRSDQLAVVIKQELPDHVSNPEPNSSFEKANSINDLTPSSIGSMPVVHGDNSLSLTENTNTGSTLDSKECTCSLQLTEAHSHGICADFLLSNRNISVDHQFSVSVDLQAPVGSRPVKLQLSDVAQQQLGKSNHSLNSPDVSPSTSSNIDKAFDCTSTLCNPGVTQHMQADDSRVLPSLLVDSGLIQDAGLSDTNNVDNVSGTELLSQTSAQFSGNDVSTDGTVSEKDTGLVAKHRHCIFHALKPIHESKLNKNSVNKKSNKSRLNKDSVNKKSNESKLNKDSVNKKSNESKLNKDSVNKKCNESKLNKASVNKKSNESKLNKDSVNKKSDESRLNKNSGNKKSNENKLALLLDGRCKSPHQVNNSKWSALRLSSRYSLDSATSSQSKLGRKIRNMDAQSVCGQRTCITSNLTDSEPARKEKRNDQTQSSSNENFLTAKEKVFNMWKRGQVVENNKISNKIQRNKGGQVTRISNPSRPGMKSQQTALNPKKAVISSVVTKTTADKKMNQTKQKIASSKTALIIAKKSKKSQNQKLFGTIGYVIIHGYKLLCLQSKSEELIFLCEFLSTCFPDKTIESLNNCIDQILKIKKGILEHSEKETIITFLQKRGCHSDSLIHTISVDDGRRIYHHMYGTDNCTAATCLVETPSSAKNSTVKLNKEMYNLETNSANRYSVTIDSVKVPEVFAIESPEISAVETPEVVPVKSPEISAVETLEVVPVETPEVSVETCPCDIDSSARQSSDDPLKCTECINTATAFSDIDETLVYGETSSEFSDLDEVESIVNHPFVIRWLPGTPKTGGLFNTYFGKIRSYKHSGEIYLAVDDLCRLFNTTDFSEGLQKENIVLYSCCKEIESFLNELDLNFPPLKSQHQSLVKQADIGVPTIDDNVFCNSENNRSSILKRELCMEGDCEENSIPHKYPRLADALHTDSDNHITLKMDPSEVTRQSSCQSNLLLVEVHNLSESCPESMLERIEVAGLPSVDAQSESPAVEADQIFAVTKSISSRLTPCLDKECSLTSSGDRLHAEKCVHSKKYHQGSETELTYKTYAPIDITSTMDTGSCWRNTDSVLDQFVIRQQDLLSPSSDRSTFSPDEQFTLLFDDRNNLDEFINNRSKLILNQGNWSSHKAYSLLVSCDELNTLGKDSRDRCLTPQVQISGTLSCELEGEKTGSDSYAEAAGRVLRESTPSKRKHSVDCVDFPAAHTEPQISPARVENNADKGTRYLLASSVQFRRFLDDTDVIAPSSTSMLVPSSYRSAYEKLWQQHMAVLDDNSKLTRRCKYYEDLVCSVAETCG